jgi:nitrite reductase (NADH) large subunit
MKLVVIGNGMVGHKLLEQLAGKPGFEITVLCEEPRPAYDRVGLTGFFSGKSAAALSLVTPGFFETSGITLHLNDKAAIIDRAAKLVRTAQGRQAGGGHWLLPVRAAVAGQGPAGLFRLPHD